MTIDLLGILFNLVVNAFNAAHASSKSTDHSRAYMSSLHRGSALHGRHDRILLVCLLFLGFPSCRRSGFSPEVSLAIHDRSQLEMDRQFGPRRLLFARSDVHRGCSIGGAPLRLFGQPLNRLLEHGLQILVLSSPKFLVA